MMTRNKSPRVPSYRLHKPTGLAVVRLNGRDFYLGKYGTSESKQQYERLIAEWLANHRQLPASNGRSNPKDGYVSGITIDELIVAYLDFVAIYYVKNRKPTSTQQHIKDALRPLHEIYGQTAATDFGPLALKALREQAIQNGRWSRCTINKAVSIIKRMFKWAAENELISVSTYQRLDVVGGLRRHRSEARETPSVKPVADANVDAVLPHVSRQVKAMIELQLCTGMRPGEVAIMRAVDIDTSGKVWTYTPESHKTEHHDKARAIFLGPQAQKVLAHFLTRELTAYFFNPTEAEASRNAKRRENRQSPMTPSQAQRRPKKNQKWSLRDRYDVASYRQAIHRGCEKAFPVPDGLSDAEKRQGRREHRWGPNQLRHNAATRIRKEYGLDAARAILGHSAPNVTEIYAEMDYAKAADIMAKIG